MNTAGVWANWKVYGCTLRLEEYLAPRLQLVIVMQECGYNNARSSFPELEIWIFMWNISNKFDTPPTHTPKLIWHLLKTSDIGTVIYLHWFCPSGYYRKYWTPLFHDSSSYILRQYLYPLLPASLPTPNSASQLLHALQQRCPMNNGVEHYIVNMVWP